MQEKNKIEDYEQKTRSRYFYNSFLPTGYSWGPVVGQSLDFRNTVVGTGVLSLTTQLTMNNVSSYSDC